MTFDVVATFEDGVFRPETPVSCPDHARVHLKVEQLSAQAEWDATREQRLAAFQRYLAWIEVAGINSGGQRFTREELYDRD